MRIDRIVMLLAALGAGVVMSQAAGAAASAEKGKAAFIKHGCWQCHGFEGQGSVASSGGTVLAHTALPVEAFIAFVRSTNRAMPSYSDKLVSDADLADMYAYLQSVPKAKDPKTIPLLNQ
jgi:mono/diheme cytochrome c family protein